MSKEVREQPITGFIRYWGSIWFDPWVYMVAWGAFLHMTGFDLPFLSYWQVFMLNIVCGIFTRSQPIRWIVR